MAVWEPLALADYFLLGVAALHQASFRASAVRPGCCVSHDLCLSSARVCVCA